MLSAIAVSSVSRVGSIPKLPRSLSAFVPKANSIIGCVLETSKNCLSFKQANKLTDTVSIISENFNLYILKCLWLKKLWLCPENRRENIRQMLVLRVYITRIQVVLRLWI